VIDIAHHIMEVAGRYGLRILFIDATDVTLMARVEILPAVYIQIYQNIEKDKLNMALIFGNDRAYGVDSEGGTFHEHPTEDPIRHTPMGDKLEIEVCSEVSQYFER
jgi:hypothetical protein